MVAAAETAGNSGSAKVTSVLVGLLLLTLVYWGRQYLLGRFVACMLSLMTHERVTIRQISLQPLQLFHVEIVTRQGLALLVSRVQVDVHLKAFFATFGVGKLVRLYVDDITLRVIIASAIPPPPPNRRSTKSMTVVLGILKCTQLRIRSIDCQGVGPDFQGGYFGATCALRDVDVRIGDVTAKAVSVVATHTNLRLAGRLQTSPTLCAIEDPVIDLHLSSLHYTVQIDSESLHPTAIHVTGHNDIDPRINVGVHASLLQWVLAREAKQPLQSGEKPPVAVTLEKTTVGCKFHYGTDAGLATGCYVQALQIAHQPRSEGVEATIEATLDTVAMQDITRGIEKPIATVERITGRLHQLKTLEAETIHISGDLDTVGVDLTATTREAIEIADAVLTKCMKSQTPTVSRPCAMAVNLRCNHGTFQCREGDNLVALAVAMDGVHLDVAKAAEQKRIQLECRRGLLKLHTPTYATVDVDVGSLVLHFTEAIRPTRTIAVDMSCGEVDVTAENLPVAQLRSLLVATKEIADELQVGVNVDRASVEWPFASHRRRLDMGDEAQNTLRWAEALITRPTPAAAKPARKLALLLECREALATVVDVPDIGTCCIVLHVAQVELKETLSARIFAVHSSRASLQRAGAPLVLVTALSITENKPADEAGQATIQLDVGTMAVHLQDHLRILALILQLHDLANTKLHSSEPRLPPPLKLHLNVPQLSVDLLDTSGAHCVLNAHHLVLTADVVTASSSAMPPAVATLLADLDTVLDYENYRSHISRVLAIAVEIDLKQLEVVIKTAPHDVLASLELKHLVVSGSVLDVAATFAAVDPRAPPKRVGLLLHIAGDALAVRASEPRRAGESLPHVMAALAACVDTAGLDPTSTPTVNPRLKFFGGVDIALTNSQYTHTLAPDVALVLRVGQFQLVCDKCYRIDCHLAGLTLGIPADVVALARVAVIAQWLVEPRADGVDVWSTTVAASVRALHDTDVNLLALEWSTLVAAIAASELLTAQPTAPAVAPAARSHTIAQVSLQLTVAPLQLAWWEGHTAGHAFLVAAETVDVTLVLAQEATSVAGEGQQWALPKCRVAATGTKAFQLESRSTTPAGLLPFARPSPSAFFIDAGVIEYAKSSLPFVPIHVDDFKLLWTLKLRDQLADASARVHADLMRLGQQNASVATPPAAASDTPVAVTAPASLLELLEQGKLGPRVASAREAPAAAEPAPELVKKYQLDIEHAQINVLEPTSKSSLVVAARHLHVEWGYDSSGRQSMAHARLREMQWLVAPLDVDIGAGILWYAAHRPGGSLLRPVLEECAVSVSYALQLSNDAMTVDVELPALALTVDSTQFHQCLSVVKHVLLAPPSKKALPLPPPVDGAKGLKGKRLAQTIADELRMRDLRSPPGPAVALKTVGFHVGHAACRLRTSPEDGNIEFVLLELTAATGRHVFYDSTSTKFTLNLEWLEIQNLKPGAASMNFDDPMAVLTPRLEAGTPPGATMLSLRAESQPLGSKDNPALRVYDVLEVSFFPGVAYDLAIQLAVDFYELMFTFFFGAVSRTDSAKRPAVRPAAPVGDDLDTDEVDDLDMAGADEVFFFNYVRVGSLCLHVASHGFVVNLNGFGLELPPFLCRGKLCTWKRLLRKFELHLAWCVSKESASSGLNHVKKKLFTLGRKGAVEKKVRGANMTALFGPYHRPPPES
ncbi:hypothetical protein ACHHYP_13666 [Achlya hypogyna]|uniref:Uncharacterized protein n=1 Tax=Achlya hypogyna TaxID=1202772 RepID=A0A1V9YEW5_ACHHY|nr:hypothetical protein ACHHYP_13666 [Achlya hypogyna]